MFENIEQMNVSPEQIRSSISELMRDKKAPLLRILARNEQVTFSFLTAQGGLIADAKMYDLMIESARVSSNIVQRVQLEASLKIAAIRQMFQDAASKVETEIWEYLYGLQGGKGPEKFLLFGHVMGELKLYLFEISDHPIGKQVREIPEDELYEIFNFQKPGEEEE